MAQVQTVSSPDVSASGGPVQIATPAAAFGANVVGEAAKGASQATGTVADMFQQRAAQLQELNNKTASDQAWQGYTTGVYKFADEWKQANQRDKATANLSSAYTQMEQMRQDAGKSLASPMAKAMFDADSRRQFANVATSLSSYAVSELNKWHNEVASGKMATLSDQIAADPTQLDNTDPQGPLTQYFKTMKTLDDANNVPEEFQQAKRREEYGKLVTQVVAGLQNSDRIPEASAVLEKHKGDMDQTTYNRLGAAIRPVLQAQQAHGIAADAIATVLGSGPATFAGKARLRENGPFGTNIGKNPGSSASGYDQFLEGTWLDVVGKHPDQFPEAKGLDRAGILALRNNADVADRGTNLYALDNAKYLKSQGLDASEGNLGLAHAFGPGGAKTLLRADPNQPISTVFGPDVVTKNRLDGQTVGQVIQGVNKYYGGATTSVDLESRLSDVITAARARAEQIHPGDQAFSDRAADVAKQQLGELHTSVQAQERDVESRVLDGVLAGGTDMAKLEKILPGATAQIQGLPPESQHRIMEFQNGLYNQSPGRIARYYELLGKENRAKAGDVRGFLDDDLHDLNATDTISWMKKQAAIGGKGYKSLGKADDLADKVYRSPEISSALAKIPDMAGVKDNDPRMYRLLGLIHGEIETWAGNYGKLPSSEEINSKIIPRVFFNQGEFLKEDIAQGTVQRYSYDNAKSILSRVRGGDPSELDIGTLMARTREAALLSMRRAQVPYSEGALGKYISQEYRQMAEAGATR